ncbi:MAG: gas vesicle protein [Deltaproteobacteria bacterium]|nr:gas vesicle protein [Deltaproteobacteria bacterium]
MKPARRPDYNLSDVLDRLLDKGIVINAELVISVAGIPLVGVALTAAVAGMETMSAYGVMGDMDKRVRERKTIVTV